MIETSLLVPKYKRRCDKIKTIGRRLILTSENNDKAKHFEEMFLYLRESTCVTKAAETRARTGECLADSTGS